MEKRQESPDTNDIQSKISFAPTKSRRSAASEAAAARKVAYDKKQGVILEQPRLKERKQKQLAKEKLDPKTLSQQNIDEILNGQESKELLSELTADRFKYPRFHQEDLSIGDKVLRMFDASIKYGPAQGLTRLERWNRANRLGKHPPYQIKAILEAAQQTNEYKSRYEMSIFGRLGQ